MIPGHGILLLDRGLDGFRCDAVPYLFEREDTICENLPETHRYLKNIQRSIDQRYKGRMVIGRGQSMASDVRPYFRGRR